MWTTLKAPSLAELETMAHEIFQRLPTRFRDLCEGVVIRVDDFATDEVLDEMDAETEFDLLGLFQGTGRRIKASTISPDCPTWSGSTDDRSWTIGPSTRKRSATSSATS